MAAEDLTEVDVSLGRVLVIHDRRYFDLFVRLDASHLFHLILIETVIFGDRHTP